MTNFDDYVTGHEDDIVEFDYESFSKKIITWQRNVEDDLKKNPYDMNLLCIDAVLNTVFEIMEDNTRVSNCTENVNTADLTDGIIRFIQEDFYKSGIEIDAMKSVVEMYKENN